MNISLRNRMLSLLGGALLTVCSTANAVSVAQVPLFLSAAVQPNVMLMLDNSGSMNNVIWATGYSTATVYADWSPIVSGNPLWSTNNPSYSSLVSSSWRGTCASGWTRGQNTVGSVTTTKCLKLPDPVGGGNTQYEGSYLNYLFVTYTNIDLSTGVIPNEYRYGVAKTVASNIVSANSGLRLGLSSFNNPVSSDSPGGKIDAVCGTPTATLLSKIAAFPAASTYTPLAETFYELTRYFRGMTSQYNSGVTYTSPIQYRCQQNFVIMITDGYPTTDTSFPTTDPADVADATRSLPTWDNKVGSPASTAAQFPNLPQYSDGFQPSGSKTDEGYTLYLDDLAKFGYDIDLKTSGNDLTGVSFNDPAFPKQNLNTYTVGFTAANQMLSDAAAYGRGNYYQANNAAELTSALQAVISDIQTRISTAASVATNSTRLSADSLLYQAKFDTSDWTSQFLAYPIEPDGTLGTLEWDAGSLLPAAASRSIYTYDPTASAGSRGRTFLWASLNATQKADLNKTIAAVTDTKGSARLDYVRGDATNESPSGYAFRPRGSKLGDIINSDPAYVGGQNYGFNLLPGTAGSTYKANRPGRPAANRRNMVYVAANDGMLHAFDAATGSEKFAYVPNPVISQLTFYADPSFNTNHRLINDGSPATLDAYLGSTWKTILVGALGGGGRGVYALDVTNPDSFGTSKVMWEFTSTDDSDMGVAIPQPAIARLNNGTWVAIVANGYNSTGQNAVLFVLDLATGAVLKKLNTGVGSNNGLSNPAAVDVDGDRIVDYVYAGDLKGNMWKFDLTSASVSNWKVAFTSAGSPAPLYTACSADPCTAGNRQLITARPEVGLHPTLGYSVYFGTGSFFAVGDNAAGGSTQTFYGIRDRNGKDTVTPVLPTAGRSNLVQQSVIYENLGYQFTQLINGSDVVTNTEGVRVTTNNAVADSKDGWYLNLPTSGERQVSNPQLRAGKIEFTTLIPSGDACSAGGDSWLMVLDSLTGSRLTSTPFDNNKDGTFDRKDFVLVTINGEQVRMPLSGVKSKVGIVDNMVSVTNGEQEFIGDCGTTGNCEQREGPAGILRGRQSWREIQ